MSPLGQKQISNIGSLRNLALATNIRGLNYDLTRDRPCVSVRVSMHLSRKAPERTIDSQVRGDKPCVSLPGEAVTAWNRDQDVYLEYSNQYAERGQPGRGERLETAEHRAELPYCCAKKEKREDGGYAKPLVGYRNYQGRQPTAVLDGHRLCTGASESAQQARALRSSYKEFRVCTFSTYECVLVFLFIMRFVKTVPVSKQTHCTNPASKKTRTDSFPLII